MTPLSRRVFLSSAATVAAASVLPAAAQTYPSKPLRILVPFTAGGSSDILARILSESLRDPLGQAVVVENRPGGNSSVALLGTLTAPPDGYTMVVGHIGTHAITPPMTPGIGYDVAKAFTTIAVHASSSNLLVVPADSPVTTFKGLIELAKSKPGELNYGSPGNGSPSHVSVLQLAALTGINVVHVPYRGNSGAVTDLLGGRLQFMIASPAEVIEQVKAGKLRPLAASGAKRSPAMPDVVPIAELGYPNYNFRTWHVTSVRSDTPPDIVAKLRKSFSDVEVTDGFRKRLAELSLDPGVVDGAEAEKFVQSEIAYWSKFVKDAGLKVE